MKKRINYLIILVPFIMGLVFGSLFDLPISQALYSDPTKNVFGIIFSAFMPMISYAFVAFAGGYILKAAIKEKYLLFKIGFYIVAVGCFGVAFYFTGNKFYSPNAFTDPGWNICGYVIGFLVEAALFGLGFFTAHKKGVDKYFVFGAIVLLVMYTIALVPVSQILKAVMRRPRYRTFIEGSPFFFAEASFHQWWEPFKEFKTLETTYGHDAISEHFKSFPSGHTGETLIVSIGLVYVMKLFPSQKDKETLWVSIGMVFSLLMALSRITMGAHFLSDVAMGGLSCALLLIAGNEINLCITYKILDKQKIKK